MGKSRKRDAKKQRVREKFYDVPVYGLVAGFLLPGLIAGSPRAHNSQVAASTAGTSRVARAIRVTPTSALPPERSMIEAAPTTSAPAPVRAAIVSRVEPPVVITSSTTST